MLEGAIEDVFAVIGLGASFSYVIYLLVQIIKVIEVEQDNETRRKDLKNENYKMMAEVENINQQIRDLNSEPKVTDHAFVQYLRRMMDIDVDGIKQEILSHIKLDQVRIAGDGVYPMSKFKGEAVMKGLTVVTIYEPPGGKPC